MKAKDTITLIPSDGSEPVAFYIIDQVTFQGRDYLMVSDVDLNDEEAEDTEDGTILILKDMADKKSGESLYEIVDDDTELGAVSTLFKDTLDELGIDIEMEEDQ